MLGVDTDRKIFTVGTLTCRSLLEVFLLGINIDRKISTFGMFTCRSLLEVFILGIKMDMIIVTVDMLTHRSSLELFLLGINIDRNIFTFGTLTSVGSSSYGLIFHSKNGGECYTNVFSHLYLDVSPYLRIGVLTHRSVDVSKKIFKSRLARILIKC